MKIFKCTVVAGVSFPFCLALICSYEFPSNVWSHIIVRLYLFQTSFAEAVISCWSSFARAQKFERDCT